MHVPEWKQIDINQSLAAQWVEHDMDRPWLPVRAIKFFLSINEKTA